MFISELVASSRADQLLFYVGAGTVIGARLGHCLFYESDIYLSEPIRILKIWEGGLASHGAAVGILIALWAYNRRYPGLGFLYLLDRVSIAVALAGFFIRLGNLLNSEILGIPSSVPWAFVFARIDHVPRHPTQLYEAMSYLTIFFVLRRMFWFTAARRFPGFIGGLFFVSVFLARFILEFFKENQETFENRMLLNMGQILSIPLMIAGAGFVFWSMLGRESADVSQWPASSGEQ